MNLRGHKINFVLGRMIVDYSGRQRDLIRVIINKNLRTSRTNRTNENRFVRAVSRSVAMVWGNSGRTGRNFPIELYTCVYAHMYRGIGEISSGLSKLPLNLTENSTYRPDELVRLRPASSGKQRVTAQTKEGKLLTLQQIAALKRDAFKPNWGLKAYSSSTVIDLIEVIEQYIGEIPVDRPKPRDPFDLSYQAAVGPLNVEPNQMPLFTDGNFLIIPAGQGGLMGDSRKY